MQNKASFSIIIPTYNYAEYLPDAINSVLDQSYPGTEILVIDDASTDNTSEVASKYKDKIIYYKLEKNLGAAGAWGHGLKLARGEYVCKLDADDQQIPGFLDTVAAAFEQDHSIGIVVTSVMMMRAGNTRPVTKYITDSDTTVDAEEFRKKLLHEYFFHMPGVTIRRSIIAGHTPPENDLYQLHDWEYFLRVTRGYKARLLAKPLARYRIHNRSITSTAREGNLDKDCNKWMNMALKKGAAYMDGKERRILAGSLAIHMMRSINLPDLIKALSKYPAAFRMAAQGGPRAIWRLNFYLINKAFHILHRGLTEYAA